MCKFSWIFHRFGKWFWNSGWIWISVEGRKRPSFIEGNPHLCNASNFFIETKKKLFLIYFLSLFSLHSGTFSFLILILVVFPFYTSFPLFFWCFLMNQITFFYLVFIIASLSLTSGNIKYKEKKRFINSLLQVTTLKTNLA